MKIKKNKIISYRRFKNRMLRLKFGDKRIVNYYYVASILPGCMDYVDKFGILKWVYRYWGWCYGCVSRVSV